jgi:hypothetical protein
MDLSHQYHKGDGRGEYTFQFFCNPTLLTPVSIFPFQLLDGNIGDYDTRIFMNGG